MKYASFTVFKGKVILMTSSDEETKEILRGLERAGIKVEEEYRGLCG